MKRTFEDSKINEEVEKFQKKKIKIDEKKIAELECFIVEIYLKNINNKSGLGDLVEKFFPKDTINEKDDLIEIETEANKEEIVKRINEIADGIGKILKYKFSEHYDDCKIRNEIHGETTNEIHGTTDKDHSELTINAISFVQELLEDGIDGWNEFMKDSKIPLHLQETLYLNENDDNKQEICNQILELIAKC